MKNIKLHVSMGLNGCKREIIFEVPNDFTYREIEAAAFEELFNVIDWSFEEIEN